MNTEIDNSFIINDKILSDKSIDSNIDINISKSTESLNREFINEENKLIVDYLREENENLRVIIRLCLILIDFCRCHSRRNTTERNEINLLLSHFNNNSNNDKLFSTGEKFQLLSVNDQKQFDINGQKSLDCVLDKDSFQDQINCIGDQLISPSDHDWCEENSDQDYPESQSDDGLIGNCLNNRVEKKSKRLSHRKSEEKSTKRKTNAENSINSHNKSLRSAKKSKSSGKPVGKRGRVKSVRDPNVIFRCDWIGCGKVFKNQSNLNGHKDIHLEIKKYRCDWPGCDEAFLRKEQLDVHVSSHTNEKRFK